MEVIEVTTGVYWVDIPQADLRILCGCPADSVKHLKQRGLIRRVDVDGVMAECGPNAILLSDLPLQGGEFSNLGEFPVLQMLYRQGMLLPNHPNNTGRKPILIGRRDQLRAQMDYIYRGNYGLTSQDELEAAGVPPAMARDWMRIKLSFAFGTIRRPEELLQTCTLESGLVEIKDGVFIRRLEVNIFEISYGDERIAIDLNLAPGRTYSAPFRLGYRNLRREYFAVAHSGEGDGWDVHRPAMGSLVIFQGRVFLVDTGPNIQTVLAALGIGIHEVEGVFHTHCHDDHFAGLTTLVRADHRVRYFATQAVRASVAKKLAALTGTEEAAFEDFFEVHDLDLGQWNDIDGLEVRPLFSPHPVETTIFQFRALWEHGWKTYSHYADIASFRVLDQMTTDDPLKPGISPDLAADVKSYYLAPADVKKVDIGGGMIHGEAIDFSGDPSARIILTHTARDLTLEEKEIGSGAPFGTVDVLIPALQEYPLRLARSYLGQYFPEVPEHQLRILLNHPLEIINPESILIRDGFPVDRVYLILTGIVESISARHESGAALTAGAMVGELPVLTGRLAEETVRAGSFVTALVLPKTLYATFVRGNGLEERVRRMASMRQFFNTTWILGEHLSSLAETRIATACIPRTYPAGSDVPVHDRDELLLIRQGNVHLTVQNTVIEDVGPGGLLGATQVLFGTPPFCRFVAATDVEALAVPGALMRDTPITRWKLMETHNRRMTLISTPRQEGPAFPWLPDYAIGVPTMDREHQRLLDLASMTAERSVDDDPTRCFSALDDFISYTIQHFSHEEDLLASMNYRSLNEHKLLHRQLLDDLEKLRREAQGLGRLPLDNFRGYVHTKMLSHIFREDSRYVRAITAAAEYIL
jgi:hemerythrin